MIQALGALPDGSIVDLPGAALGQAGPDWLEADGIDWIPLPASAVLTMLPGRPALGGPASNPTALSAPGRDDPVFAAAAHLPNGFTRTAWPATRRAAGAPALPLFGYTAVGRDGERILAAAIPTEDNYRWQPAQYDSATLEPLARRRCAAEPRNRLLPHIARCAVEYGCYNAQNIFYGRWEGGLPVSGGCNARCVGCISLQPEDRPASPQERLAFKPTVEEVVEVAVAHLSAAPDAIISFGQGCEGEPLSMADLIAAAVKEIRRRTDRGTIHMNTNGSLPEAMRAVAAAGLDSVRVSLNSPMPERYNPYYRPVNYSFEDVESSIRIAKAGGLFVSLNLLCAPGYNDAAVEVEALIDFCGRLGVDKIQLRNLTIDPDDYLAAVPPPPPPRRGVRALIEAVAAALPGMAIGNFSPALR